ncbi:MAG: hypothetical protein V4598_06310 [Bdellovibrionota bacterium]
MNILYLLSFLTLSLSAKEYSIKEGTCEVRWASSETSLQYRGSSPECQKSFDAVEPLHELILLQILKDVSPSKIRSLHTGGLITIQPDGSWTKSLKEISAQDSEWLHFREHGPQEGYRSSNAIMKRILGENQVYDPFTALLRRHDIHMKLESVEKVFTEKDPSSKKSVIQDAGMIWWSVLSEDSPERIFREKFSAFKMQSSTVLKKSRQLNYQNSKKAKQYRTSLLSAWKNVREPNFAGNYFVPTEIGCGTGCAVIFAIEWNTGKVFEAPKDSAFAVLPGSRLLILNPFPPGYISPPEFYEFQSGLFKRVDHIP